MRAKKSAFTLVELLVVISIIALLMGILTPALASARRSAYKTACKQNLHGCAVGFRMYMDDNRNYMPSALYLPTMPTDDEKAKNIKPLNVVMAKYLSGNEALKCPADPQAKYFREQGSSYEYNTHLNGIRLEDDWFAKRFGTKEVWILKDYGGFHGKPTRFNDSGEPTAWSAGSYMYLYGDTLVANREREK
jgi:prepilin-type N-terminal cleavage/methylation domain-containing protein